VRDYVRSGEVQLDMRLVSILGPDSGTAARYALAAGRQNRLWQFTEVFFAEQKAEGSGYVTQDFLRDIAEQVPGLDVERVFADASDGDIAKEVSEALDAFSRYGLTGTPSFRVGRRGGEMKTVTGEQLPDEIAAAVESAGADRD
jgi:predicted DsbA family dithiol-disulfide isomerase